MGNTRPYPRSRLCGLSVLSFVCVSVFMLVPCCSDYHSFVVDFETRKYETSNFVLLQDCFGLEIPYDF